MALPLLSSPWIELVSDKSKVSSRDHCRSDPVRVQSTRWAGSQCKVSPMLQNCKLRAIFRPAGETLPAASCCGLLQLSAAGCSLLRLATACCGLLRPDATCWGLLRLAVVRCGSSRPPRFRSRERRRTRQRPKLCPEGACATFDGRRRVYLANWERIGPIWEPLGGVCVTEAPLLGQKQPPTR